MHEQSLENLARRMAEGDGAARAALESALEPYLARIVRRALSKGASKSDLARRIVTAAARLDGDQSAAPADLERLVTDNVGRNLMNRLWGPTECFGPPATVLA